MERVLSWKFVMLDKNGDGYLDRAEYKELRRLAKKAVRPKKCARTFARTCDLNRDLKLSRQEWGACLANDFTRKFNTWCTCISHDKWENLEDLFGLLDDTCTLQRSSSLSSCLNDHSEVSHDQRITMCLPSSLLLAVSRKGLSSRHIVGFGIINSSCKHRRRRFPGRRELPRSQARLLSA